MDHKFTGLAQVFSQQGALHVTAQRILEKNKQLKVLYRQLEYMVYYEKQHQTTYHNVIPLEIMSLFSFLG